MAVMDVPWFLESDTLADDPVWDVLSGGKAALADAIISAHQRLKAKASHTKRDGYVTADMALQICRGRKQVLEALCRTVLDDPPLLHRQGDDCECLGGSWIEGFAYRFHNFLKRNPSRKEYDRNQAQRAELRNAALRRAALERDGGCCRYCTSGPLSPKAGKAKDERKRLTFDHVHPDQLAGEDLANFVTACERCNQKKGKRTPAEADMVLLPAPTPAQAAILLGQPQVLCDLPAAGQQGPVGSAADQRGITAGSDADQTPITDPASDRITDPISDDRADPIADPDPVSTGSVHPPAGRSPITSDGDQPSEVSGLGRGGQPDPDRPPRPATTDQAGQPYRPAHEPDPYTKRARLRPPQPATTHQPAVHEPQPPPPEYRWPPGAVPAEPPAEDRWGT